MRRMFTTAEAVADGLTASALRWGEARGRWRRVRQGVYVDGREEPTAFDRALADVVATERGGQRRVGRRRSSGSTAWKSTVVRSAGGGYPGSGWSRSAGLRCTDGLQTMIDLAGVRRRPGLGAGARVGAAQAASDGGRSRRLAPGAGAVPGPGHGSHAKGARVAPARSAARPAACWRHSPCNWSGRSPAWVNRCASSGSARCSSTCRGPASGCSSSSTASNTSASPSTTPGGRPPSWPPPAGCADDSPGPRWSGCRSSTARRMGEIAAQARRRPFASTPPRRPRPHDDCSAPIDSCTESVVIRAGRGHFTTITPIETGGGGPGRRGVRRSGR